MYAGRIATTGVKLGGVSVLLLMLELASRTGVVPATWFPPVTVVYAELFRLVQDASLWSDVALTLQGWGAGLLIAAALAIPIGMMIGSNETAYRSTRAAIEFLRPIPSVALIPLAVLIWGVGLSTKVFLAAFAAFWPLLFQALYGVREVDPVARDTFRSYRIGRFGRIRHLIVPSAAPFVATGMRISSSIALILAVTAEMVIGTPGLGRSIVLAQSSAAIVTMYALILVAGLLGWLLNGALERVERRTLRWHPSQRMRDAV